MLITLAYISYYIFTQRLAISEILSTAKPIYLFYGFLFGFFNLLAYGYVTHVLYRGLGAKLSFRQTFLIILVSRLGVYLPGRIWYASNFYFFSRKLDIPPLIISQSFIFGNIFLFLTGGALSLPILTNLMPLFSPATKIGIFVFVFLLFVLFHPSVLKYFAYKIPALRIFLKKTSYIHLVSGKLYFKVISAFFFLWILTGAKIYSCILSLSSIHFEDFLLVLASGSASLLTGLLAIFAPGGIGVQEGVGVFVLSGIIPVQTALLVMIISRLLQVITELGLGISALYFINTNKTLPTNT